MTIEFPCPACRQQVRTPDAAAGKKGKCPSCGTVVAIPGVGGWESGIGSREPGVRGQDTAPAAGAIEFPCQTCGQTVRTPAAAAGKKGKCPSCQAIVLIPAAGNGPPQPPPPATPRPSPAKTNAPAAAKPGPAPAPPAKKLPVARPLPKARPLTASSASHAPAKPAADEDLPTLTPLPGTASGLTPLGPPPAPQPLDPYGGLTPLGNDPLAGLSPLPSDPLASLPAAGNPLGTLPASPLNPYASPTYGGSNPGPSIDDSGRRGLPFQQRAAFGTFWSTTGWILGSPDDAFRQMKRTGGLWNPINFAISATITGNLIILAEWFVVVAALISFLSTVFKEDMGWDKIVVGFVLAGGGMLIAGIVSGVVGSLIAAAVFHVLLLAMGGARAGFEATLRVVCYGLGSAWMLFPVPCVGSLLVPIWQIIVLIQGFKHAHGISGGMAALAVIPVVALYWTCLWGVTLLPYLIPSGAGAH